MSPRETWDRPERSLCASQEISQGQVQGPAGTLLGRGNSKYKTNTGWAGNGLRAVLQDNEKFDMTQQHALVALKAKHVLGCVKRL